MSVSVNLQSCLALSWCPLFLVLIILFYLVSLPHICSPTIYYPKRSQWYFKNGNHIISFFFTYKCNCRQHKVQKSVLSFLNCFLSHSFCITALTGQISVNLAFGCFVPQRYRALGAYYSLYVINWFLFLFHFVSLALCMVEYFSSYWYYISQDLNPPLQKRFFRPTSLEWFILDLPYVTSAFRCPLDIYLTYNYSMYWFI